MMKNGQNIYSRILLEQSNRMIALDVASKIDKPSNVLLPTEIIDNNSENEINNSQVHHFLRQPMLILHIGPSKTGTSAIQCNLQTSPH